MLECSYPIFKSVDQVMVDLFEMKKENGNLYKRAFFNSPGKKDFPVIFKKDGSCVYNRTSKICIWFPNMEDEKWKNEHFPENGEFKKTYKLKGKANPRDTDRLGCINYIFFKYNDKNYKYYDNAYHFIGKFECIGENDRIWTYKKINGMSLK